MTARAGHILLALILAGCESQPEVVQPPTADELGRLQMTYEERLRQSPADLETRESLARVLLEMGQLDRSMTQFQTVLQSDSLHVGALLGLSEILARIRDPVAALEVAKRAVEIRRDEQTLQRLAVAWLGVDQPHNAYLMIVEAIQMDPDRATLHELMGALQMAQGDVAAAQTSLERAVELDPTSHEASFALGSLSCERLGRCVEGLDFLQRAVSLAPDSVRYRVAAGRALLQAQRIRDAMTVFEEAADRDPSSVDAQLGLGVSRLGLGMHAEAARALEKALKLDPVHPDIRLQLASVYHRLGRSAQAEAQRAAHKRIDPYVAEMGRLRGLAQPGRMPEAHFELARLYARLGHDEGTVRSLREGLTLQPGSARAWLNLGNAHVRLARSGEAISAYRQALDLRPDYGLAWYNLGTAYATGGYIDLGREAYERALKLLGESADVLTAMGNLELHQGNAQVAVELYGQALSQKPELHAAQRGLVLAYRQAGDSVAATQAIARFRSAVPSSSPPAMRGP
ncbi:MAG: tetratricopeptide repeat protein [Gemmatimonadetes bacterium]|nr:tetratricopeptide repeat protein [Gemmatimonadota bacterium]